ncbi:MAG: hypothetical protein AAB583_05025, partial [Patescibacteria group bacterium]
IIPGQLAKRNTSIKSRVQQILKRPVQTITKAPTEQPPKGQPIEQIEQAPDDEMSVERARKILEYLVNIPESGLDAHESHLTPTEQFKRFGGTHYKEIRDAFKVYADHLVETHGAKKFPGDFSYELIKEDLPGPPEELVEGKPLQGYYNLELAILREAVRLRLRDAKRYGRVPRGVIRVESQIPLVDIKPDSPYERDRLFYDILSLSRPIGPGGPDGRIIGKASLGYLRLSANKDIYDRDPEQFHREYKNLHRGMRWAAANLLCWDENKTVYPDDLDKPPFDKGKSQLSKPELALPPK